MKESITKETILFVAVIVTAIVLRIWGLNQELWYDEIVTLTEFVRRPVSDLLVTFGSMNNHLAYTWLAKASTGLLGEAPWSLRLPAAILGVLSIWAVWRLIRFTNLKWVALVSAALLAVSYHHVWFSQNARGYTGLLLFTSLSALSMGYALKRQRISDWALYAVFAAAALMIHLTAAFLLTAQGLTALAVGYREVFVQKNISIWPWLKGPLIGFGGAVFITLLIYAPMAPDMIETFSAYDTPSENKTGPGVEEWQNPLWTIIETLRSFGAIGAAVPFALAFAAIGAVRLARNAPVIAIPFLIHIPMTVIILTAASFRIWPRYFFIDIGFLVACVVYGAFWVADATARYAPALKRLSLDGPKLKIIGSIMMVFASLPLLVKNYGAPKQEFEGAAAYIARMQQPGETVMTVGLAELPFGGYLAPEWPHISSYGEFKAATDANNDIWIVVAFPTHLVATYPEIADRLEADFDLASRFSGTLSGGEVFIYHRRAP